MESQAARYASYSYWLETSGDDLTPRPRLDGSTAVDVAVMGAGYTGLWTAYYLPAGLILAAHRVPFRRIVNPWPAIALGLSIGRPYAVMAFASAPVLVLVSVIYVACERIAVLGIAIPFVWTALSSMIVLAVPTAYARFLGSWVREHRYEIS